MPLAEYNEAEQMALFKKDGIDLFAKLVSILLEKGLIDDVKRASRDEKYRKELLNKYNLF